MNGKRAEINNTSKHVVLVSSPLSVLSSFFLSLLLFYRISSVCLALHAGAPRASLAPLARAFRALAVLDRLGDDLRTKFGRSGRLGRALGRFGAVLDRFGVDLGTKLGPK